MHTYRLNWAWTLNLTLHLQSTAQMKCLNANCCRQVVYVRSKMERLDFSKLDVKMKHIEISSVQSLVDALDSLLALQILTIITRQMNDLD